MASTSLSLTLVIYLSFLAVVSSHTWVHCTKYSASSPRDFGTYNDDLCDGYPRGHTDRNNLPFGADSQDFDHTYPIFQTDFPFQADYENYPGRPGELRVCFKNPTYPGRYQPANYVAGERVCLAYPAQNHVPNRGCVFNPFTDLGQRVHYQPAGQDPSLTEVERLPSIELPPYGSNCPNYCRNTQRALCTACFTVPNIPSGRYTFIWRWDAIRLRSREFNPTAPLETPISYFTCWEANVQGAVSTSAPTPAPIRPTAAVNRPTAANPPANQPPNNFRMGAQVASPELNTDYFISPQHAPQQCLEATGTQNGATVSISSCHGGDTQKWSIQNGRGITFVLVSKQSGRVIDIPARTNKAILWEKDNRINEQFQLLDEGEGKWAFRLMSSTERMVLEVPLDGRDGVQVQTSQHTKSTNQMWTFHQA